MKDNWPHAVLDKVIVGDCREVLKKFDDDSIHCVVTSPPYWGLRDYGVDRQMGLEKTPAEFISNMVEVFEEVRRVLRPDGTLWLNMGDSYAGKPSSKSNSFRRDRQVLTRPGFKKEGFGLKPKDMIGMPWRLAFALQAAGWYLRSDIIWHKINPMPETVSDRPTKAHEFIFLLAKNERYFCDMEAIKEPVSGNAHSRGNGLNPKAAQWDEDMVKDRKAKPKQNASYSKAMSGIVEGEMRNKRDVWSIISKGFPGAHFATFPEDLVKPCILAGTSQKGCCSECGSPWVRNIERQDQGYNGSKYGERVLKASGGVGSGGTAKSTLGSSGGKKTGQTKTVGWKPSCKHDAAVEPCVVLDPFGGACTVALVAAKYRRHSVSIELNPAYARMGERRIQSEQDQGKFL